MSESALSSWQPERSQRAFAFLRATFRHHAWFVAYVAVYVAIVVFTLSALDRPFRVFDRFYILTALVPIVFAAGCVVFGQVLYHILQVRPFSIKALAQDIRDDDKLRLSRLGYAAIPILVIVAFQSTFTSFKSSIPFIQPFEYDQLFMEIDRTLHFGKHPWELLQPIFGYPIVTSIISLAYKIWAGVFYLVLFWMAFSMRDRALRMRYLLSYVLTWSLIGSLAALSLSSAGPVFYGHFVAGEDPYTPLIGYLESAGTQYHNWSLVIRDYLWVQYNQGQLTSVSGISAMPSMHVAVAALQALLGWKVSRRAGWLLTGFCAVILIGSVHLGWHYAIDGYLSILAVIVIWKAVGWALRFHPSFAWGQEEPPGDQQAAPAR